MRLRLRSSNLTPRSPRALAVAKWFVRGWGALAVAFGVGFAVFGALEWDRASASVGWPTAAGTVAESRVHHTTRTKRGRTSSTWSPDVTYRYTVDGREFEAQRISFRVSGSSQSEAQAVVDAHPVGSAVIVHHAPDDPSIACLEPGAGDWQWVPLAIGAAAVVIGFGVAWILPRKLEARIRELASAVPPAA
ncbi:MAG: DUF3592 domain-containing protein [Phycisphaerales bacterium]